VWWRPTGSGMALALSHGPRVHELPGLPPQLLKNRPPSRLTRLSATKWAVSQGPTTRIPHSQGGMAVQCPLVIFHAGATAPTRPRQLGHLRARLLGGCLSGPC